MNEKYSTSPYSKNVRDVNRKLSIRVVNSSSNIINIIPLCLFHACFPRNWNMERSITHKMHTTLKDNSILTYFVTRSSVRYYIQVGFYKTSIFYSTLVVVLVVVFVYITKVFLLWRKQGNAYYHHHAL